MGQVLEIDLMAYADSRRDDLERLESLHAPFQELITLPIALELHLHIEPKRIARAREINLHRMIDNKIDRDQRLDELWIFSKPLHRGPHGGQIHEERHAGEVLKQDSSDDEWYFFGSLGYRLPTGEFSDVGFGYAGAVAIAQHGFEHDANANRQAGDIPETFLLQLRQRVALARPPRSRIEALKRVE